MLHPSDSPAPPQQGLNLPEGGREEGRKTERGNIWKWISLREMVFIFTACSVGAALFQNKDNIRCLCLPLELPPSFILLCLSDLCMRGAGN